MEKDRYGHLTPEERDFNQMLDEHDEHIKYLQQRIDNPLSDTPLELRPSPMRPLRPMGTKGETKIDFREQIAQLKESREESIQSSLKDASPEMRLRFAAELYHREKGDRTDIEENQREKDLNASQSFAGNELYKEQILKKQAADMFAAMGSPKSHERSEKDIDRDKIFGIEKGEYNDEY